MEGVYITITISVTSLLRRLQAQILPDEAHHYAKSTHSAKLPLLFNQCTNFDALQDLECLKNVNIACFMTGSTIFNRLGMTAPKIYFS